jgi:serine/threonine protein phosphatase PrpC
MGTYLSTPVTEKCKEEGDSLECPVVPVSWGVVDMQGWRKSMEDAHVAQTDIAVPMHHIEQQLQLLMQQNQDESKASSAASADAKVFGVFDGHGGPEVARFCQLYLTSVLTQQLAWAEESPTSSSETNPALRGVGEALVHTFHALDRMIDDPTRRCVRSLVSFFLS